MSDALRSGRSLIVWVLAVVTASGLAVRAEEACHRTFMPGVGVACRDGDLLRVEVAPGVDVLTHGGDPVPSHSHLSPLEHEVPPACVSDRSSELHGLAIYAHASDTGSRYPSRQSEIRHMLSLANGAFVNEAARHGRRVDLRFACDAPGIIRVDNVQLTTAFAETTFQSVVYELIARGYTDPMAKYQIFFDGQPPGAPGGQATLLRDDRLEGSNPNNYGPGFAVTWGFTGWGGAFVMLHEAAHTMGAVSNAAPNTTGAGHCNDGLDIMCYNDGGPTGAQRSVCTPYYRFDCGNDDYFHPNPPAGSYPSRAWNLAAPFNRMIQGCSFSTGMLVRPGDQVSVDVPAACRGRWFAAMGFLRHAPAALGGDWAALPMRLTRLPDVDVCWFDGVTLLRCDTAGLDESGSVPASATRATITLRDGAVATYVLSIV